MSAEAIEKIRSAEKQCEEKEALAKRKAEEIISKANSYAEEIIKDAKINGEKTVAIRVSEASLMAEKDSEKQMENLVEILKKLDKIATEKHDEALALIKENLIS